MLSKTCFRIRRRLLSRKSKAKSRRRRVALAAEQRARSSLHQVPPLVQGSPAKQIARLSWSPRRFLLTKLCRQTHRVIPMPTRTSWTCLHYPFSRTGAANDVKDNDMYRFNPIPRSAFTRDFRKTRWLYLRQFFFFLSHHWLYL